MSDTGRKTINKDGRTIYVRIHHGHDRKAQSPIIVDRKHKQDQAIKAADKEEAKKFNHLDFVEARMILKAWHSDRQEMV